MRRPASMAACVSRLAAATVILAIAAATGRAEVTVTETPDRMTVENETVPDKE